MENNALVFWLVILGLIIIMFTLSQKKKRYHQRVPRTKEGLIVYVVSLIAKSLITNLFQKGSLKSLTASPYQYRRKNYFMSKTEHDFFNQLYSLFNQYYHIFPQVHLSTILDQKVVGQNWKGALSHIDRKSVDFVICDKTNISPLLAIELDDATHTREDRVERDAQVEAIFQAAGLPLLRFENKGQFDRNEIYRQVYYAINPQPVTDITTTP